MRWQSSAPFVARQAGRRLPTPLVVAGGCVVAAWVVAHAGFYVVQPTEMAGVRRFGVVTTAAPIGPGLHVRIPFIDQVDRLQVSLRPFRVDDQLVYTVDNQPVHISIGLSYRVPKDAVFKLLYGVGGTGNVDIDGNLRPIVADRAMRVFARHNTISISSEREAIANDIRKEVTQSVGSNFGIEVVDLQLSRIAYSPAFTQSIEAAVRAKNDAIQAENTVMRVRYEGEQAKVQATAQAAAQVSRAEGEARAAVTRAEAEKQATVLRAQGEAQATLLTGEAQARVIQQVGTAVAANPLVVQYETARRWNGQMPATMLGSGTLPLISLPAPDAPAPVPAAASGR